MVLQFCPFKHITTWPLQYMAKSHSAVHTALKKKIKSSRESHSPDITVLLQKMTSYLLSTFYTSCSFSGTTTGHPSLNHLYVSEKHQS